MSVPSYPYAMNAQEELFQRLMAGGRLEGGGMGDEILYRATLILAILGLLNWFFAGVRNYYLESTTGANPDIIDHLMSGMEKTTINVTQAIMYFVLSIATFLYLTYIIMDFDSENTTLLVILGIVMGVSAINYFVTMVTTLWNLDKDMDRMPDILGYYDYTGRRAVQTTVYTVLLVAGIASLVIYNSN
jgi:hypothetical protein